MQPFDNVISRPRPDLPWGQRELNFRACQKLYPALLRQIIRVLRPGSGTALLITQDTKLLQACLEYRWAAQALRLLERRELVIGSRVSLYVLQRLADCH